MTSIPLNHSEFCILVSRENARHNKAYMRLEQRLSRYQEICPHKHTRFIPDPSGNNDSQTICIQCNKEL